MVCLTPPKYMCKLTLDEAAIYTILARVLTPLHAVKDGREYYVEVSSLVSLCIQEDYL